MTEAFGPGFPRRMDLNTASDAVLMPLACSPHPT
jgi:hypothetical protein